MSIICPLFFDETASLFDYLPQQTLVFTPEDLEAAIDHFREEVGARYEDRRYDRMRPILPPRELFLDKEVCFSRLKAHPRVTLMTASEPGSRAVALPVTPVPDIAIDGRAAEPTAALKQFLGAFDGRILLVCGDHRAPGSADGTAGQP